MFSESLAGRKKLSEIYPVNFAELFSFNGISITDIPLQNAGIFVKAEYERFESYYETYINYGVL